MAASPTSSPPTSPRRRVNLKVDCSPDEAAGPEETADTQGPLSPTKRYCSPAAKKGAAGRKGGTPHRMRGQSVKNRYDFFEETDLGEGATSKVFLGRDKQTGSLVALKSVARYCVKDWSLVRNEEEILRKMRHTNIVNLMDTFQDTTALYFVLEYCEGGELFKYMERFGLEEMPTHGPWWIAEVVSALEYLHNHGVVHRDLKPENLLLTRAYHVKLGDFGTAVWAETAMKRLTSGTASYMDVRALEGRPVGSSVDLWALGCIVFQMFHGSPPWQGETDYLTMKEIKDTPLWFPPYFHPTVKEFVAKLLQREPHLRLGFGPYGYRRLKQHAFFAQVDWKNLDQHNFVTILNANYTNDYRPYLQRDEEVILAGPVIKTAKRLSHKPRDLVLTDAPRLFYVDTTRGIHKGDVPWSTKLIAEVADQHFFNVHTPARVYHFQSTQEGMAELWVREINRQLKKQPRSDCG